MKVKNIMFSGFMAVILMGVAGNASAAAVQIASKAYVDGRVNIADTTTVAAELEKKADKSEIGTLPSDADEGVDTVYGYITQKTSGIATDENLEALTGRVATAEGKVTTLEGKMTTAESDIGTLQGDMTTAQGDITSLQSAMTGDGDGSVAKRISDAVSTAKGELTTEINKKADSTTVDGISGRVTALEGAGYQNAGQVSGAITNALVGYATEDYVGTQIQSATENMATDTEVQTAISALSAEGGEIANLSGTVDGIGARVTTAEGEIDTLQSEMDAVEAKAAANETAIGANTNAIAGKVAQTAYDTKMSELDAEIAKKFALPEGCTGEGANCVLSSIGGNIQWVDITAPLQ